MSTNLRFGALDALEAKLHEIFEQAGPECDLMRVKSHLHGDLVERTAQVKALNDELESLNQVKRAALGGSGLLGGSDGSGGLKIQHSLNTVERWADETATKIIETAKRSGVKALTSGSIDVPSMVSIDVAGLPGRPDRLINLIIDRKGVSGNEFEFLRQTVRTNNAAPVADSATKPTSVFTVAPVTDRVRVIAHLSEPIPERLLADHAELKRWLVTEMVRGVLDALEGQIVNGDAVGENLRGILNTTGIGTSVFNTDIAVSLRKGITAHQLLDEQVTAIVLHPSDAETLDLLREGTNGAFLVFDAPGNVLKQIPRVVSRSVPAGTALLGDWREIRLVVREDVNLAADRSGPDLFDKNLVKVRAEGRFGIAVLRPQAFRTVAVVGV
jgi:HK97 family phage major capsid protein